MPEASRPSPPRPPTRRGGWWLLVAAVLAAHALLMNRLADDRLGWGDGQRPPPRIEVAFVRDLQAAAPPEAVGAPAAPAPAAPGLAAVAEAAPRPARAASAPPRNRPQPAAEPDSGGPVMVMAPVVPDLPEPAPPLPVATPPQAAVLPAPRPAEAPPRASAPELQAPALPAATAPVATVPASAAASAVAFEWPPSTRLSYKLSGYYRGPVDGSAQVEWLRQGERYQVRMGTSIGPVLSRSIVSEGRLTEQGLQPQRFTGEQKVLFRAARRWGFSFEPEQVRLDDGSSVPSERGAQDEASQFVQLTWLFSRYPERLKAGQSVELPLIVSRRLNRWVYDVVGQETLNFPFGPVATWHLKPRQAATGGDLSAEMWIAPSLQYLPVRILLRQNTESSADLTLERLPEQAAR